MDSETSRIELTRRRFMAATGAVAAGVLVGCPSDSAVVPVMTNNMTKAYRLSTRGVSSASNAAKLHAANMRFLSPGVASNSRAHPGDKSKIVPIDISRATWQLWFGGGGTAVDLRKI